MQENLFQDSWKERGVGWNKVLNLIVSTSDPNLANKIPNNFAYPSFGGKNGFLNADWEKNDF